MEDKLKQFADNVQNIVNGLEGWNDRKVFIWNAYKIMRPNMDLDTFKQNLGLANNKGYLTLTRADLVSAMDPEDVQKSETFYHNGEFHFIVKQPIKTSKQTEPVLDFPHKQTKEEKKYNVVVKTLKGNEFMVAQGISSEEAEKQAKDMRRKLGSSEILMGSTVHIEPIQENKLRVYVRMFLSEGRLEVLQKKYPDINVKELFNADPSPTKKYVEWMIRQLNQGVKKEDLVPTIQYFNRNQQKFSQKDINQYKTLKDLENAAKDAESKVSSTQQRKIQKTEGTEKIYEDDYVIVLRVDTKEACVIYGSNTRWCITMADSYHYEHYKGSNVIFYFILSKIKMENDFNKVAIAYQRNVNNAISQIDFFDQEDNQIDANEAAVGIYYPIKDIIDPEGLKPTNPEGWFGNILEKTSADAIKQPKAFLARLQSGEYTREELKNYLKTIQEPEDEEKRINIAEIIKKEDLDIFFNDPSIYVRGAAANRMPEEMLIQQFLPDLYKANQQLDVLIKMTNNLHKKWADFQGESNFEGLLKRFNIIKEFGIEAITNHQINSFKRYLEEERFESHKKLARLGDENWRDLSNDFDILMDKFSEFINLFRTIRIIISVVNDTEYLMKKYKKFISKHENKLPSLKSVFEWSQHLDMFMFDNDDNEEKEDEEDRPTDEYTASNPFHANNGMSKNDVNGVGGIGYKTRMTGAGGTRTNRYPGGKNIGITGK